MLINAYLKLKQLDLIFYYNFFSQKYDKFHKRTLFRKFPPPPPLRKEKINK